MKRDEAPENHAPMLLGKTGQHGGHDQRAGPAVQPQVMEFVVVSKSIFLTGYQRLGHIHHHAQAIKIRQNPRQRHQSPITPIVHRCRRNQPATDKMGNG